MVGSPASISVTRRRSITTGTTPDVATETRCAHPACSATLTTHGRPCMSLTGLLAAAHQIWPERRLEVIAQVIGGTALAIQRPRQERTLERDLDHARQPANVGSRPQLARGDGGGQQLLAMASRRPI